MICLCYKWLHSCSLCQSHTLVLSLFMTYHQICNKCNTIGVTDGEGTFYPSGTYLFTHVYEWFLMVQCLFVLLHPRLWLVCYGSMFICSASPTFMSGFWWFNVYLFCFTHVYEWFLMVQCLFVCVVFCRPLFVFLSFFFLSLCCFWFTLFVVVLFFIYAFCRCVVFDLPYWIPL